MFKSALITLSRRTPSYLCLLGPKRAMCTSSAADDDWDFEPPQFPTESWDLYSTPRGDAAVGWPTEVRDGSLRLQMSACEPGVFPQLQASVGRLYPSYGDKQIVKSPSAVQLANGLLVTAAHAVPIAVSRKGQRLPLNSPSGIPVNFSPTAPLLRRPLLPAADTAYPLPAPTSDATDKCPLTSVPWTTPSHPQGPDVRFLKPHSFTPKGGLAISHTELKPGEAVILCAYMREFLSYAQAAQWLRRSDDNLLESIHPKLVKLKSKKSVSALELSEYVMEPWTEAFTACQSLTGSITKMFSYGKVLAVKDGMIATDISCTTCASGGALVRQSDPNSLCGIHLGLPRTSPIEAGNFNLQLSVQHPAFQEQLGLHGKF